MTDSSTPFFCTSSPQRLEPRLWRACGWLLAAGLCWALPVWPAKAQSGGEVSELRLERIEGAWYVSASMQLALPPLVEQALRKGLAVQFVMQADLLQPRWYWRDARVAQARRYLRLTYQPLTRRWRLSQSSAEAADAAGLGFALGQQFDDLGEVLASLQRVARWKIADDADVDAGKPHVLHFDFSLDASQLPRPLQFGTLGRSGWNMHLSRSLNVPAQDD